MRRSLRSGLVLALALGLSAPLACASDGEPEGSAKLGKRDARAIEQRAEEDFQDLDEDVEREREK